MVDCVYLHVRVLFSFNNLYKRLQSCRATIGKPLCLMFLRKLISCLICCLCMHKKGPFYTGTCIIFTLTFSDRDFYDLRLQSPMELFLVEKIVEQAWFWQHLNIFFSKLFSSNSINLCLYILNNCLQGLSFDFCSRTPLSRLAQVRSD